MNNSIKYYLAAYNAVAFVSWLIYDLFFCSSGLRLSPMALLWLNIAQGMAMLEIAHALFKWVKSPVVSTAVQVASRVFVVILINVFIKNNTVLPITHAGVVIISLAWSITELVRYSFYFFGLFNIQPRWLLFMRYTFFILLYPLGVTGEWFIIGTPVIAKHFAFTPYFVFAVVTLFIYVYYFPVLYKYMWKQRRAKLP